MTLIQERLNDAHLQIFSFTSRLLFSRLINQLFDRWKRWKTFICVSQTNPTEQKHVQQMFFEFYFRQKKLQDGSESSTYMRRVLYLESHQSALLDLVFLSSSLHQLIYRRLDMTVCKCMQNYQICESQSSQSKSKAVQLPCKTQQVDFIQSV